MNYKIKVNSEAESKEVQGLLEKLGFKKSVWGRYSDYFIFANSNYYSRDDISNFSECDYKEITLPELRDLVVLKHNSIDDATHACDYPSGLGVELSGVWYAYNYYEKKWELWGDDPEYKIEDLKPIEKPMKEYLNKETHEFVQSPSKLNDMWVEIPEWANFAAFNQALNNYYFNKENIYIPDYVIWQRHQEETISDKVASAEMARQELKERDLRDYSFAESDALIESNVEQSSTVKTLAERQSTYGNFSKVAEMTQGLLFVMSRYGYNDMPDTHKESIHMIASKIARIVNGDNNHLDSWHDIGGYSKLIENLIKSDDDNS